jgi:Leucine-rich repeat (LRR) protein
VKLLLFSFLQLSVLFIFAILSVQGKDYDCKFTKVEITKYGEVSSFAICELKTVNFNERTHFNLISNEQDLEVLFGLDEDYIEDDKINDEVKQLRFKSSKLSTIPNVIFWQYKKLEVFDATSTELKYINKNTFQNAGNLRSIFLQNNQMNTIIHNCFDPAENLETLDLSNNAIVKVHSEAFAALKNLQHLNLSKNKIAAFDDKFFENLHNLKWIGLEFNRLTMIASTLFTKAHQKLEGISLSFNQINEISPHIFDNLENLRFLLLTNNKCVDKAFKNHIIKDNTSIKIELNQCFKNYRKAFPQDNESFNITEILDRLGKSTTFCNYEFTSVNESMVGLQQQLEQLIKI